MGSGYLCSTVLPRMSSLQCAPLSYNRKVRDDKLPWFQHAMAADILIIIYCDMGRFVESFKAFKSFQLFESDIGWKQSSGN